MKKKALYLCIASSFLICLTSCGTSSSNNTPIDSEAIIENVIQDQMTIEHIGEGFGIHDFTATYTDFDSNLENVDVEITATKLSNDEKSIDITGIVTLTSSKEQKHVNGIYQLKNNEIISAKEYFTQPETETETETETEIKITEKVTEKNNNSTSSSKKHSTQEQPTQEQSVQEQPAQEQPVQEQPQPEVTCGWAGPGWQSGYLNPAESTAVAVYDASLGGDLTFYAPQVVIDEFSGYQITWLYWGDGTGMVCWGRSNWGPGENAINYFSQPDGSLIKKRTTVPDSSGNGGTAYDEYY